MTITFTDAPADAALIEQVRERFRRPDDQIRAVRPAAITDTMLYDTFGPQGEEVAALVRRVAIVAREARGLAAARLLPKEVDQALTSAKAAAEAAAEASGRLDEMRSAGIAAATAWSNQADYIAAAAAWALAVRDLIGQHGFTQAHYDALTGPWASVVGPDDAGQAAGDPIEQSRADAALLDSIRVRRIIPAEVTGKMLDVTFGPQWQEVVALVRRAAVLTPGEAMRMGAARADIITATAAAVGRGEREPAQSDRTPQARAAARAASRAILAAVGDTGTAVGWHGWPVDFICSGATAAASALGDRDTIREPDVLRRDPGFTQAEYDTLTGPWASVIGPVHPDDGDRTGAGR